MNAGPQLLLLSALAPAAFAACYKHLSCSACIAEVFGGGSCMWYENLERAHPTWSCIAGMIEDAQPKDPAGALIGSTPWSAMSPQGLRNFSILSVDTESEESCYRTGCEFRGACPLGFYATENIACDMNVQYQEYRKLKCCRQQRLTDGYLRGFEVRNGVVRGSLQYAACCLPCMPGQRLVDCNPFSRGTCELCPQGTYNPSGALGSKCEPCQPCPAGFERILCGSDREGRCEPCATNKYKTIGLEGDYNDKCQACSYLDQCSGFRLIGCGGAYPGHCRRCATGDFYTGVCRQCSPCFDHLFQSVGCGGSNDGTCVLCGHGSFEGEQTLGRCKSCKSCDAHLSHYSVGALTFTGPSKKVGCGAFAEGECVRLAAELDSVVSGSRPPRCVNGSAASAVYCPGAIFKLRWAVEGPVNSYFGTGKSNCSHATGACMAGVWRASLLRRSFSNAEGQEIAQLGYFDFEEPTTTSFSDGIHIKTAILKPLPVELLGGAGYFIRLAFEDEGNSCCAGVSSSPLYADTQNFQVADVAAAVFEELQRIDVELVSADVGDHYQAIEDRLRNACADAVTSAMGGAQAEWARLVACEKVKALQMGQDIGEFGLTPLALPAIGPTSMARAQEAAKPVNDAKAALAAWYALDVNIPTEASTWKALLGPSSQNNVSNASRRLNSTQVIQNRITTLASGIIAAANATRIGWQGQIANAIQQVNQSVEDLKELDTVFTGAATALRFSTIRMAQETVDFLWAKYANSTQFSYVQALDIIGSLVVMLLGTWRRDWVHELTWYFAAEIGEISDVTYQSFGKDEFGGVQIDEASADAPLSQSRSRVWMPVREVSTAWFDRMAADGSADGKLRKAGQDMQQIITCIESATEALLLPLSRNGASLLKGALPDIVSCGSRGAYLQNVALGAKGMFPGSVNVALMGLGPGAHHSWKETKSENQRLRRAAFELVQIFFSRATLFRNILALTLDTRDSITQDLKLQEVISQASAVKAIAPLIASSDAESGPTSAQAEWRWHDTCSKLLQVIEVGKMSAACLSRRNLGRFERLAIWVDNSESRRLVSWRKPSSPNGDIIDLDILEWNTILDNGADRRLTSSLAWRKPWHTNGSVADLDMAVWSTMVKIAGALDIASIHAHKTGFLRIEASVNTHPLLFAGLAASGRTLLNLQSIAGQLRVHREVYAYLIGSAWPAEGDDPNPKPTMDPHGISVPYVEMELQHLSGHVGQLVHSAVPRFTRHEREKCASLEQDTLAPSSAALEPLYGLWMLSARDGATGIRLSITDSTYIRLLVKVDVPKTQGPWNLMPGPRQYLYQRPSSEDCNDLQLIAGLTVVIPSTTVTTSGTTSTTTVVGNNPQLAQNTTTFTIKLHSGFLLSSQSEETVPEDDSSSPFVWLIPAACLLLLAIIGLVLRIRYCPNLCTNHPYCRKLLPKRIRKKHSGDDVAAFDSPSPKGSDQLRHRVPTPKAESQSPLQDVYKMHADDVLRGLGVATDRLGTLQAKGGEATRKYESEESDPEEPLEEWGAGNDTPRKDEESSGSSTATSEDESEATTSRSKANEATLQQAKGWGQGPLSQHMQQRAALMDNRGLGASPMVPPIQKTNQDSIEGHFEAVSSSCSESGDSRRLLLGSREAASDLRDTAPPPPTYSRGDVPQMTADGDTEKGLHETYSRGDVHQMTADEGTEKWRHETEREEEEASESQSSASTSSRPPSSRPPSRLPPMSQVATDLRDTAPPPPSYGRGGLQQMTADRDNEKWPHEKEARESQSSAASNSHPPSIRPPSRLPALSQVAADLRDIAAPLPIDSRGDMQLPIPSNHTDKRHHKEEGEDEEEEWH